MVGRGDASSLRGMNVPSAPLYVGTAVRERATKLFVENDHTGQRERERERKRESAVAHVVTSNISSARNTGGDVTNFLGSTFLSQVPFQRNYNIYVSFNFLILQSKIQVNESKQTTDVTRKCRQF